MKKEAIFDTDSENLIKDKFLLAGLIAVTGNLNDIVAELLDLAYKEFKEEVDANYKVSDLVNPTKGSAIFETYRKYFTIVEEELSIDYFLEKFSNPQGINVEWVESKKGHILTTYDSFSEHVMNDKDFELIKTLYLVLSLNKGIGEWNREGLTILQPDYFTSGRKSRLYKNKKTRKLLSLEKNLFLLSEFDKKMIINEEKARYQVVLDNEATMHWRVTQAYSAGVNALNEALLTFDEEKVVA